MSGWEIWTWLAVGVLGPGSLVVFVFFLTEARRLLRELSEKDEP